MSWEDRINEEHKRYMKAQEVKRKEELRRNIEDAYSFTANVIDDFRDHYETNLSFVERSSIMDKILQNILDQAKEGKEKFYNYSVTSPFYYSYLEERSIWYKHLAEGIIMEKLLAELPSYTIKDISVEYRYRIEYESGGGEIALVVKVDIEPNYDSNRIIAGCKYKLPQFIQIEGTDFDEKIESIIEEGLYSNIRDLITGKFRKNSLLEATIRKYEHLSIESEEEDLLIGKIRLFSNVSNAILERLKTNSKSFADHSYKVVEAIEKTENEVLFLYVIIKRLDTKKEI